MNCHAPRFGFTRSRSAIPLTTQLLTMDRSQCVVRYVCTYGGEKKKKGGCLTSSCMEHDNLIGPRSHRMKTFQAVKIFRSCSHASVGTVPYILEFEFTSSAGRTALCVCVGGGFTSPTPHAHYRSRPLWEPRFRPTYALGR